MLDIESDQPVSTVHCHSKASDCSYPYSHSHSYDLNYADDAIDGHNDDTVDAIDSI